MDSLNTINDQVKNILDNLKEGCQIINSQFRYTYVNEAVAKQGKSSIGELMGKTMMEAYPGIENTQVFPVIKKCMEDGVPKLIENEFTYKDGSKSWFELRLNRIPEGVLILSTDISERKSKEDRFKILISNLSEMIHIVDPNGKTTYVSPSVYKIVGYTPEEFIVKNGNDYIHPEDFAKAMGDLKQVIDNPGVTMGPFEFRVRHKDGTYKLLEVTGLNLINNPAIRGIIVTSKDISRRRKREEEVKSKYEELEKMNKLMINRELKMVELKKEIERLKAQVPTSDSKPLTNNK